MFGLNETYGVDKKEEVSATIKMVGFFLGLGAFLSAVLWFIPKDLFTTATWLDSKQLGLLYSNGATAFAQGSFWDITDITVPVSEEAFRFSVLILLLQFIFMFLAGTAGSYVNGKNVESPIHLAALLLTGNGVTASNFNWKKLWYVIVFVLVGVFDTFTDWQFSSKYGQANLWLSLVYSYIVYNLASEYAFMIGLQFAVGYAPDAIAGAIQTFMAIITAPFQSSGSRQKSSKGKPQEKPQQSQQQGRGKPQQQGNPRQQPPGRNNNNGGNRGQNGNGRNGGAPQSVPPMPVNPRAFDPRDMPELLDTE